MSVVIPLRADRAERGPRPAADAIPGGSDFGPSLLPDESFEVHVLLKRLQRQPFADRIIVFGSAARGHTVPSSSPQSSPSGLDAVVDLHAQDMPAAHDRAALARFEGLLYLARQNYGCFVPFLRFKDGLLVRSIAARDWMHARRAADMRMAVDAEGLPLREMVRRLELRRVAGSGGTDDPCDASCTDVHAAQDAASRHPFRLHG